MTAVYIQVHLILDFFREANNMNLYCLQYIFIYNNISKWDDKRRDWRAKCLSQHKIINVFDQQDKYSR